MQTTKNSLLGLTQSGVLEIMPKTIPFRIATACILLLGAGLIAAFVFDANPLARAKPEDRSLAELLDDMDVELLPASTTQVRVRLQDVNGADVDISNFRGNIVFLNFFATWCSACVVEMPAMQKLHRNLHGKPFAMVAVSIQESVATVRQFFRLNKLTFEVLLDPHGKTVPGFGIRAIPTTLVLDKSGRIIGRMTGPREWDGRESIALFKLLADN